MKTKTIWPLLAAVLALGAGCAKSSDRALPAVATGHTHVAPHGGTLVPLGEHAYNLELVRDGDSGKLTAYVLDGHAENFIRIAASAIELTAISGGERRALTLRAIANPATGETVGDTSQFEAQADWIKRAKQFPGEITGLDIRGAKFERVAFHLH
jgi:hypothetical protein